MDKRAYKRVPVYLNANFSCCSLLYYGTVTNISERGMRIRTKKACFPFDLKFVVSLTVNSGIKMRIPVNLRWMTTSDEEDGIGVELQNPSESYLKLIKKLELKSSS